jgi:Na+-driven multidrug efflux pump
LQVIFLYFGTIYLAATNVIFSIFRINKTLVGGFSQGAAILVGNALEPGKKIWLGFALYQVFHALILFIGFLSKKWLYIELEERKTL